MTTEEDRWTARERLTWHLQNPGLVGLDKEEADELIDALLSERAAELVVPIFEAAIDCVRNQPSLVRPDEERT
jgi:hypothetical protein